MGRISPTEPGLLSSRGGARDPPKSTLNARFSAVGRDSVEPNEWPRNRRRNLRGTFGCDKVDRALRRSMGRISPTEPGLLSSRGGARDPPKSTLNARFSAVGRDSVEPTSGLATEGEIYAGQFGCDKVDRALRRSMGEDLPTEPGLLSSRGGARDPPKSTLNARFSAVGRDSVEPNEWPRNRRRNLRGTVGCDKVDRALRRSMGEDFPTEPGLLSSRGGARDPPKSTLNARFSAVGRDSVEPNEWPRNRRRNLRGTVGCDKVDRALRRSMGEDLPTGSGLLSSRGGARDPPKKHAHLKLLLARRPTLVGRDSVEPNEWPRNRCGSTESRPTNKARLPDNDQSLNVPNRRPTSSAFSRLLNAEIRKNPSPQAPKPLPGVTTTFSFWSIRSNICQLVRPSGVSTQM